MATQGHLAQFDINHKTWNELNYEKIYREDLGTESFVNIKTLLDDLTTKINRTNQVKEKIGDGLLSQVYNVYKQIISRLNQVISYDNGQFVSNKAAIETQINAQYEQLLNSWPQVVAIINDTAENQDASKILEELDKRTKKTELDAKEIENLKTRLSAELNDFEKIYKDQFKRAELVNQREIFSIQSSDYNKTASNWLIGVIISSIILVIILWVVFKNFCFDLTCYSNISEINYNQIDSSGNRTILYLEVFKAVTYRLLLISFVLYIVNFCVKNYNASKHNQTVNSQKANSLNAALVLLERAKTNEGNDNIMSQAASAIFSHQPTGYNKKDPENIGQSITEKIIQKVNPIE